MRFSAEILGLLCRPRKWYIVSLAVVVICAGWSGGGSTKASCWQLPARPFWARERARLSNVLIQDGLQLLDLLLPVRKDLGPDGMLSTFVWWGLLRLDGCSARDESIYWIALAKRTDDLSYDGNLVILGGASADVIGEEGRPLREILPALVLEQYRCDGVTAGAFARVGTDIENLSLPGAEPISVIRVDAPTLDLVIVSSLGTVTYEGVLERQNPTLAALCRDVQGLVSRLRKCQGTPRVPQLGDTQIPAGVSGGTR